MNDALLCSKWTSLWLGYVLFLYIGQIKKTRIKPTLNNCFPQSDDISKNVMCKIGIEIGLPFRY